MGCGNSSQAVAGGNSAKPGDVVNSPKTGAVEASSEPATLLADTGVVRDGSIKTPKKENIAKGGFDRSRVVIDSDNPIDKDYKFGEGVGEGAFGAVFKGTDLSSGNVRAIKSIPKAKIAEKATICNEIAIMKMCDHPNIIKTYATYEDNKNVYLVMEICAGGELFDKILEEVFFTEAEAADIMQQIIRGVRYLHESKLIHRDIKPDNFLFVNEGPVKGNILKLIDFGASRECKPDQYLKTRVGTAYYMAPEVLNAKYNQVADVWSCGVMMFMLLCGDVPFPGDNQEQIFKKVKTGKFHFDAEEWENVSKGARKLIRNMLMFDPTTRFTSDDCVNDKWIVQRAPDAKKVPLEAGFMNNLKSFANHNRFKKAALNIIAGQMNEAQIEQLRKTFLMFDVNGDGSVSVAEVREGLERNGMECPPDLEAVLKKVDADGSGVIDYTEFLAAAMDGRHAMTEEVCKAAFDVFDVERKGHITEEQLKAVLGQDDVQDMLGQEAVSSLMSSVDTNGDGIIDFAEFMSMMRGDSAGSPTASPRHQKDQEEDEDFPVIMI